MFQDKDIHKLSIKKGNRKDFKFKNMQDSYLNGLRLRYSPLTQKKVFYLRYKFKGKASWLKLNDFNYGHYGFIKFQVNSNGKNLWYQPKLKPC